MLGSSTSELVRGSGAARILDFDPGPIGRLALRETPVFDGLE
jgi:hypothetical protein